MGFFVSGHYLTPFRPSLEDPGSKYPFTVSAFCHIELRKFRNT
nr:MAG TPA: hypothetical protein [Caudoviricetes sp.]